MPPKSKPKSKNLTKSQFATEVAARAELSKSQVQSVLDAIVDVVEKEIKSGNVVTLPGLVKIVLVNKPARPARQGRNPATGETITIKAKPASKAIKVRPIKALKIMAA